MRKLFRPLLLWFDNAQGQEENATSDARVDWLRVLPLVLLHVACLAALWVGVSWIAVAVAVALYFLRMFAVTAFYHRYFAHAAYSTSRVAQFLFAVAGSSAVQRGPLWWAAQHRHHHANSDGEDDAHSPVVHGLLWSHLGWFTSRGNFRTRLEFVPELARFPELRFLDRFDSLVPLLLAGSLFVLGSVLETVAPGLGTTGPQLLVWGFVISSVFVLHGTFSINSFAHRFGNRRYPTRDDSRNNFLLALITLGEGWHNNHHYYPAAARQGFFWWEIDMSYYGLKLLSALGIVWDLKAVPERVRVPAR